MEKIGENMWWTEQKKLFNEKTFLFLIFQIQFQVQVIDWGNDLHHTMYVTEKYQKLFKRCLTFPIFFRANFFRKEKWETMKYYLCLKGIWKLLFLVVKQIPDI